MPGEGTGGALSFLKEEIKAGIIIIASLLLLSGSVILIGGSQLMEKFDNYYMKVYNTAGLEEGSQVRLGGVKIGRILSISAPTAAKQPVTITLAVKKGTSLYKGTRAQIAQLGFVGDIYLLLTMDKTIDEKLRPGEIIPSEEQVQFDKLMARADELSQSLTALVKDVNKLFAPQNIQKFEGLLDNTNKAIVSGTENIEKVAGSLKKTTEKIETVLADIGDLVKDNKGEVSSLIKNARESLEKAKHLLSSLEETSKSVNRTVDHQSQNMDNLFNAMTSTTEDLQELMQELKNKPWSIVYKGKGKED